MDPTDDEVSRARRRAATVHPVEQKQNRNERFGQSLPRGLLRPTQPPGNRHPRDSGSHRLRAVGAGRKREKQGGWGVRGCGILPPYLVYLIRRGQTSLNESGILRGLTDPSLNETGRRQAERLGFRGLPVALTCCVEIRAKREVGSFATEQVPQQVLR